MGSLQTGFLAVLNGQMNVVIVRLQTARFEGKARQSCLSLLITNLGPRRRKKENEKRKRKREKRKRRKKKRNEGKEEERREKGGKKDWPRLRQISVWRRCQGATGYPGPLGRGAAAPQRGGGWGGRRPRAPRGNRAFLRILGGHLGILAGLLRILGDHLGIHEGLLRILGGQVLPGFHFSKQGNLLPHYCTRPHGKTQNRPNLRTLASLRISAVFAEIRKLANVLGFGWFRVFPCGRVQ